MKSSLKAITLLLSVSLLQACASSRLGKVNLFDRGFEQHCLIGESRIESVIDTLGEPFGYTETDEKIVITYTDHREKYINYLFGQIRTSNSKKLFLVFKDQVLSNYEVQREGWSLGLDINAQAINSLAQ